MNTINQANKKPSKMRARGKTLELLYRSANAKMLTLEEEIKTLKTLINKTDLIHRTRRHLEASTISEHLYNPDLNSILTVTKIIQTE